MYTSFKCKCKEEFVVLTERVIKAKGNIACPYCLSKNIKREKEEDSLKECMRAGEIDLRKL